MNATAVSESGGASGYARQILFDRAARQDDRSGSFPVGRRAGITAAAVDKPKIALGQP